MAIEKTTFVENSASARLTEIYNWISENTTDYFETITNDTENKKIICTFAGCENAKITVTLANITVTLENGTTYTPIIENNVVAYALKYAIKTSYGICIKNDYDAFTNSTKNPTSISITKNNDNAACVSFIDGGESYSSKYRYIICPEKSKVLTVTSKVATADMTTFAPIPIVEGVYPENMFFTPFSSVRSTGVITDNSGNKYFYDGYCALKE